VSGQSVVDDPHSSASLDPEVLAVRDFGNRQEHDLRVPTQLGCWPGHFEAASIVPGVVQVQWVVRVIERWTGKRAEIQTLEALKFKRPLLPGREVTLAVDHDPERTTFRFQIGDATGPYSMGRLILDYREDRS